MHTVMFAKNRYWIFCQSHIFRFKLTSCIQKRRVVVFCTFGSRRLEFERNTILLSMNIWTRSSIFEMNMRKLLQTAKFQMKIISFHYGKLSDRTNWCLYVGLRCIRNDMETHHWTIIYSFFKTILWCKNILCFNKIIFIHI